MAAIHQYLDAHAKATPEAGEDTLDLVFFHLKSEGGNAQTLKSLMSSHRGDFNDVDVFDGQEHGYIELGGWLGSQDYALRLMGHGATLGLWKLLSPYTVLGPETLPDLARELAGRGLLTVQAPSAPHA